MYALGNQAPDDTDELIAAGWGDVPRSEIPPDWRTCKPPSAESIHILREVALRYGLTVAQMLEKTHRLDRVAARREAAQWLHSKNYSLSEIGRLLKQDHTTVLHALRKPEPRPRSGNVYQRDGAGRYQGNPARQAGLGCRMDGTGP